MALHHVDPGAVALTGEQRFAVLGAALRALAVAVPVRENVAAEAGKFAPVGIAAAGSFNAFENQGGKRLAFPGMGNAGEDDGEGERER